MKMIKLTEKHYILVDDKFDPIGSDGKYVHKSGRIWQWDSMMAYVSNNPPQLIMHSTQPLGFLNEHGFTTANLKPDWTNVEYLPLSEVKELLGVVDVDSKAEEWIDKNSHKWSNNNNEVGDNYGSFKEGYNQALEDNKEKKYTEEDIQLAIDFGFLQNTKRGWIDLGEQKNFIQSLQPQTEWEVEIVNNKLKLKS